ncbi:MAG: hypothetical protein JXR83_09495 [Deltaproteobacteria bacterium]|nr:hypothetical protein [Deltaproteobacteria bacterium]
MALKSIADAVLARSRAARTAAEKSCTAVSSCNSPATRLQLADAVDPATAHGRLTAGCGWAVVSPPHFYQYAVFVLDGREVDLPAMVADLARFGWPSLRLMSPARQMRVEAA